MKHAIKTKVTVFAGVSLAVNYAVMSLTVSTGMTSAAWAGIVVITLGVTTAYASGLVSAKRGHRDATTEF